MAEIPFATTINRHAATKINDAIDMLSKSLPCKILAVSGSFVTVRFDVQSGVGIPDTTMPIAGSEWIRLPVQVGDTGVAMSVDAPNSGVSGLGSTGNAYQPANLSAMQFFPVGSAKHPARQDANKLELYGKNGVIITDTANGSAKITIISGGISTTVDVTISGKSFLNHKHTEHDGFLTGVPI